MSEPYISPTTIWLLGPEIILIATAAWIYVAGAFSTERLVGNLWAVAGLVLAGLWLAGQESLMGALWSDSAGTWNGPLLVDYFGHLMRALALAVGLLFVLITSRAADDRLATEYLGSLLLVLAGLMIVCTAGELVLLFLGLELISIPTYILLFLGRQGGPSQEATAKYFFLSLLSSALLLYGFAFLYGVAGSTDLVQIRAALTGLDASAGGLASLLPLAAMLILAGIGFKIAAVPFHFYAPDVYQGTTAGNAGLLAVVPKFAGIVLLLRLLAVAMPGIEEIGWQVTLAISLLTMTLGNVAALWQQSVRRLLAYSSIAHAGYLLIGVAVGFAVAGDPNSSGNYDGFGATLFYLVVYVLATTGTFAALAYLGHRERDIEGVDELSGVGKTHPVVALAIATFMFSLAGIPPLAGFWGKLTLFFAALNVEGEGLRFWFLILAIAAALNAAVAAAYYLRIVAAMYFRESVNVPRAEGGGGAWVAAMVTAVLVVAAGIFPGSLLNQANRASQSARSTHVPFGEAKTADRQEPPGGQAARRAEKNAEPSLPRSGPA